MKCTSEAQMAVLTTRSRRCPGPGTGSAVSRTSRRPFLRTTARIRSLPGPDRLHADHREPPPGDLPSLAGPDHDVVVEAGGLSSSKVVWTEDDGVDVAAGGDVLAIGDDGLVRDAMEGMAEGLVRLPHPIPDLVAAAPSADVAVVHLAVVGEARAQELPVAPVDARSVTHEQVRDVLSRFVVDALAGHETFGAPSGSWGRPGAKPPCLRKKVVARGRMRPRWAGRTSWSRSKASRIAWVCWSMNTKCWMPVARSPSNSTTGMFPMNWPRGAAASSSGIRSSGYDVPKALYSASGVKTSSHLSGTNWLAYAMYRAHSSWISTRSAVRCVSP